MSVDFRRLSKDDRWLYTYKCDTCGYSAEFIIELPQHMRGCAGNIYYRRRCRGRMVFASVRPDDGNSSTALPELKHEEKVGEIDHAEEQMDHEESLGLQAQRKHDHEAGKAEKEQKMRKLGSYKARAIGVPVLGVAGTGTEQIKVTFEITQEGPRKGEQHDWFGYFTDATTQRTLDALEYAGWDGDSLEHPQGLGRLECEIVLGEEEYNGENKIKVQWVNRPGGVGMKNVMTADEAKTFNDRMRSEIAARKAEKAQRSSQPSNSGTGDNTDFNYGANAGPVADKPPV